MKQLPLIITRSFRRGWNAGLDLVRGSILFLIIYGASGAGKSDLLRRIVADAHWEYPLQYYIELASEDDRAFGTYDLKGVLDAAHDLGLITPDGRERAARIVRANFEVISLEEIGPHSMWFVFQRLARQMGQPGPDYLPYFRRFFLSEEVKGRFPILDTAEINDTPHERFGKILSAMDQPARRTTAFTMKNKLRDILLSVPCVVFQDEADLLDWETIHALRGLCEGTRTPLCLVGTDLLRSRLERDHRLWTLATRVATCVELKRPIIADLEEALPNVDRAVVAALWEAGARNFRTINLILQSFQELQQENPGLKLTRRAVARAAERVLAAKQISEREITEGLMCDEAAERATSVQAVAEAPAKRMMKLAQAAG